MLNIDATVEGNILTVKIDLSKEQGESSSGKSVTVASTLGNISVGNLKNGANFKNIKFGVNVYKKK